jgi:LacI family transcriptional regulator
MLTMRNIAEHVGVSVSTVSLVMNDRDRGRVKPSIAARIRSVADELGYVPNQLARSLKTRQSHTIGLLSDEVATAPFGAKMVAGAQQAAWEAGYLLLLIDVARHAEMEAPAVQSLLQRNVESLVFAMDHHRAFEMPLIPDSVPVVVLDGVPVGRNTNADYVVPDEAGGARTAVEHLIAAGHRRIGFCSVSGRFPLAAELRLRGYHEALDAAGIDRDPSLLVFAEDADTRSARGPARDLLDRSDPPTAVFCFGDQIAMAFYQVGKELGLRVPEDLSIVGFDNQQYVADALDPGLTTIQLPHAEMGAWAAQRAIQRVLGELDGVPAAAMHMPCPLVERDSVAPPRLH